MASRFFAAFQGALPPRRVSSRKRHPVGGGIHNTPTQGRDTEVAAGNVFIELRHEY